LDHLHSPTPPSGIHIHNYSTTLPIKKGLSSSAAVSVLVARAFSCCYDLRLSIEQEMHFAYEGERLTGSKCGRMDQAGCAFGSRPVLLTFDGADVICEPVLPIEPDLTAKNGEAPSSMSAAPIRMVIVDLCSTKDTAAMLAALQRPFPHPRDEFDAGVHRWLGELNDDLTANRALAALKKRDAPLLGKLMTEAMANFDKYGAPLSPELDAPVLHKCLAYPALQRHIHGGKSIGCGGDGSAQFVCRDALAQEEVMRIVKEELNMTPIKIDVFL
jgi:mevalonate kinase